MKKNCFFHDFFKEKKMLLPPLKFTDLDKIFTGDTSHYEVPPCKISSKSEHSKYQKSPSELKKKDFKNRLLHRHVMQGRRNQGPKFLLGTVVDVQKKFHDPESSFYV